MSNPIEIGNTGLKLNTEIYDNDLHSEYQQLHSKIKELEKEKKEICDNYDAQRAKLQKLYLQKEEELNDFKIKQTGLQGDVDRLIKELDEAKSQLCIAGIIKENEVEIEKRKAEAEIAFLNQIVNESVEVSSTSQGEVKKLKQIIQMLELQLNKLKGEREREGMLLAPSNVLSGAKSLARRVVGQLGNDPEFRSHDNLEDSMKKAQEDTEVIRSLVIPLEDKIQELTEKLVTAEEKLKKYESEELLRNSNPNNKIQNEKSLIDLSCNTSQESEGLSPKEFDPKSPVKECSEAFGLGSNFYQTVPATSPSKSISCDMCMNYETQLVAQQQLTRQLEKQKEIIERNMEKFKEDLIKETQFRKCMEDKWNEKKEEHKVQVSELKSLYECAENEVKNLQTHFERIQDDVKKELLRLSRDRENINTELEELQKQNDNLMGKYSAHAEQLRNESINFPDNVEDLQELLLKSHEELIAAKVAKEAKEEEVNTLRCEIQLLRDQINSDLLSKNEMENNLASENTTLRKQLSSKERERSRLQDYVETLNKANKKNEEQIKNLRSHVEIITKEKRLYEENISELRSRVGSLQQDLDTSEAVQKDFVRLSQSLQIELEKIRGADTEVRWQHEDDAIDCLGCRNPFSSGKRKTHCRHCGKIFCSSCLQHVVLSGPHKRPSHVCQVCHTLLNRETAPYFSQEPPHSPD